MVINQNVIRELQTTYGEAFYILDSAQFRKNFTELKDAFAKIYPNANIAYSYKTNYTPKLCKIVDALGGYAEVVSEMELEIARRIGCKPERTIWNGPVKNVAVMEQFLVDGGTVNIDSCEELEHIRQIHERHKETPIHVGIRCNYDVGDGVLSRFGFDVYGDDFNSVVAYVTNTDNVKLTNFQCHFAKRQIEYWPARVKGMIDLIDGLGVISERIDIGGGLFGKMAPCLKAQLGSEIPDYEAYAKVAATMFADYFEGKDIKPELLIEPGSALVGDCMKFVCTVKTIKNVRGKWIATVLGSQKNISMTGINPPIEVIAMGEPQREYKGIDFVGFTCIEGDVLYHDYAGMLAHQDVIVISNCGSYSVVMKPPFILPNFPVLDISEGHVEVIKRGESFDDLFRTFEF